MDIAQLLCVRGRYNMRGKIIAGAVVALGLLSSPAYAVVPIPLGPLDPDTFDSATLSGGKLPASGAFDIEYTFTLTTTGYIEPVISFTSAKAPGRLPTSPVFSLFAGGTAPGDLIESAPLLFATTTSIGVTLPTVEEPAGTTYYLVLSGTSHGNLSVGGAVSTAPVPELGTWAMLLLGFAGLGYAAFRRNPMGAGTAVSV